MENIKQFALRVHKRYKTPQLIAALILFWAPVIVFIQLADEILEAEPIPADTTILEAIRSLSSPVMDIVFLVFTTIGNVEALIPITLLIVAYLLYKKQRRNALIVTFGLGGAAAANVVLKLIFQRDRPELWDRLIVESGYSFPSGHAMATSALIFALIVILWNTRWRLVAILFGGFLMVMIGLSRMYFGVHYATDIIAGWSLSLAWVLLVALIVKGVPYKQKKDLDVGQRNQ